MGKQRHWKRMRKPTGFGSKPAAAAKEKLSRSNLPISIEVRLKAQSGTITASAPLEPFLACMKDRHCLRSELRNHLTSGLLPVFKKTAASRRSQRRLRQGHRRLRRRWDLWNFLSRIYPQFSVVPLLEPFVRWRFITTQRTDLTAIGALFKKPGFCAGGDAHR